MNSTPQNSNPCLDDVSAPPIHLRQRSRYAFVVAVLVVLSGCETGRKALPVEAPPPVVEPEIKPEIFSATPIRAAPRTLIRFAQTALKKLGYNIGRVDGQWGPRSAQAIRQFETDRDLWSANGHLSELNLHHLTEESELSLANFEREEKPAPKSIANQLRGTAPLSKGAQLIIIEREYQVFAKPNPYSAKLARLEPGTGIYVVAKQEGWYEIESINRMKGFVKAD
ncbi:hypothetical protein GCM10008090_09670 [Arenicella chitinivorans]|uniref:Peptidoglycan binding-like domain-containing protein n=1 Tax=Arenicella chitinivorans TaxID=1329800 RepID=A0A918RNR9_9GAMM|nr:peptidoglycan-binding domain-containing protein [Arenicella chitinivorans]GHA02407.1 hypothetical protein GCM10008090_09670 [Arenicella chitinivorans]